MELALGLVILIWLVAAPILAGLFAGTARHGWLATVSLAGLMFVAALLTAAYGWPFDTCYTDGGCWEGLIMLPVYASLVLTAVIFALATFLRRRGGKPDV